MELIPPAQNTPPMDVLMRLYNADVKRKEAKKAFNASPEGKAANLKNSKAWYHAHKESVSEKRKLRYEKDGDILKARCKEYYQKKRAERIAVSPPTVLPESAPLA
jgi:hypothetical protein